MSKGARPAASRAAAARKEPIPNLPLPNTVKLAMVGLVLVAIAVMARALVIYYSSSSTLRTILIHANKTSKKPKKNYGVGADPQIVKDLHSLKVGYIPLGILTIFVIAFLIFGLRRPRSASGSRWVMIVALFIPTGAIVGFYSPYGYPSLGRAAGYLMSIGSIGAIILMFLPASSEYIKACRDAALPPELRGQPRPKLFGPRPTAAARPAASRPAARSAEASTGAGKSKSKARSDAEAVARGAELARSRARASKSRRTDV